MLKKLIFKKKLKTINIDGKMKKLLQYCRGSNKFKVIIKVAKVLWTKDELVSHLIVDDVYRQDCTVRTPFVGEENLKKIQLVIHLFIYF